jgi:DNA modification methylase
MYCKSENFTLYHGDNRQILPTLAENSVDAIVTDPPYELALWARVGMQVALPLILRLGARR